jgi:hypothetical protein
VALDKSEGTVKGIVILKPGAPSFSRSLRKGWVLGIVGGGWNYSEFSQYRFRRVRSLPMPPKAMKNLVRLYDFCYGCLATLCALAWYIAALLGRAMIPNNIWIVEGVFVLHATAAILTFHRPSMRPPWQPVLSVKPGRIRLAKTVFGLSIANFLVCMSVFLVAVIRGSVASGNEGVALILTSFLLLNTIYIAIHWAFRPENLFSSAFLRAISNPLGLILPGNKKR